MLTATIGGRPRGLLIGEVTLHASTTRCVAAFVDAGSFMLPLAALTWDPKTRVTQLAFTQEGHRRQGLQRHLHELADRLAGGLIPGRERSPAGDALVDALYGPQEPPASRLTDREGERFGNRLMLALYGLTAADVTTEEDHAPTHH